jgi:hypothetical protein
MSSVFTTVGASMRIAYAGDSTDTSLEVSAAEAFLVYNPDVANVIVFSVGASDGRVNAVVPQSGADGDGVVIGPKQQAIIGYGPAQFSTGTVFISVAGDSASGNVYVTPGVVS